MADGLVAADTDVVIDFLRAQDPGAAAVRALIRQRRLALTAVTAFELRLGADFVHRRDVIEPLLARRTRPLDLRAAVLAGQVAARLRADGEGIGMADSLQAGICLRFGLPLLTRNVRHFSRVPDLEVRTPGTD